MVVTAHFYTTLELSETLAQWQSHAGAGRRFRTPDTADFEDLDFLDFGHRQRENRVVDRPGTNTITGGFTADSRIGGGEGIFRAHPAPDRWFPAIRRRLVVTNHRTGERP